MVNCVAAIQKSDPFASNGSYARIESVGYVTRFTADNIHSSRWFNGPHSAIVPFNDNMVDIKTCVHA